MPATKPKAIDLNKPESARVVGEELAATSSLLVTRLRANAITDTATLQQAVIDREQLGELMTRVKDFFAPLKRMADELHKALCAREREILSPLLVLDAAKRDGMSLYKREQDRIRQQREREEAERLRRADEARAAAEAAHHEKAGDHALAAAVLEEAIAAPAPIVTHPDVTKAVVGLKFRTTWHWRYAGGPNDITQTPARIVERTMQQIPREYLCVDEPRLAALCRASKGTIKIPGIEFYSTEDPVR